MIEEEIPSALAGERLDRIVALLTSASRSDAATLVAKGGARVDDIIVLSGKMRISEGQRVSIDPILLPVVPLPQAEPLISLTVVHEDEHVVVIDKQAGLVVHPGHGHPTGTLVNGLLALYPEMASVGDPMRPGIVHRLDVGTSGLLIVARTQRAYEVLVAALAQRHVSRGYRALVWGHPESPHGVIDAPVGRDHRDPMRMGVVIDGKPARTRYSTVNSFTRPVELSELECHLETGRTHQIRVHLSAIGHPVVGDGVYGGVRTGVSSPRPFLHAAALGFAHPVSREPMAFASPLPDDLGSILSELR